MRGQIAFSGELLACDDKEVTPAYYEILSLLEPFLEQAVSLPPLQAEYFSRHGGSSVCRTVAVGVITKSREVEHSHAARFRMYAHPVHVTAPKAENPFSLFRGLLRWTT